MKITTLARLSLSSHLSKGAKAGFTVAEAVISSTLLAMLVGGIVTANLFGMRMFQMADSQLRSTDSARKTLGTMAQEIQQSTGLWIGNVTNGTFVALVNGEAQTGSALLIQPSTNATNVIIYFLNSTDQTFSRMASWTPTITLLADSVTNVGIFSAQDCFGNVLTNGDSDRVIHAMLDIAQPQPWLPAGQLSKLETSVTRRMSN